MTDYYRARREYERAAGRETVRRVLGGLELGAPAWCDKCGHPAHPDAHCGALIDGEHECHCETFEVKI
jgi:hypothetical protein